MANDLTLITGNAGKAREFAALLGSTLAHESLPLIEIQSLDPQEVARFKASQAFELLARPVVVDDTGFALLAWHGLPGALIAWFLDTVAVDGLLSMAAGLDDRRVEVTTALGYADAAGAQVFSGTVEGTLAREPRGDAGFGYDAIFIPARSNLTYAEMTPDEKNAVSSRRIAIDEMRRARE